MLWKLWYSLEISVSILPKISEFINYFSIIIMKCPSPHFFTTIIPNFSRHLGDRVHQLKFLEMTCILFSIGTSMLEFVVCHRVENEFPPEALIYEQLHRWSRNQQDRSSPSPPGTDRPTRKILPHHLNRVANNHAIWTEFDSLPLPS